MEIQSVISTYPLALPLFFFLSSLVLAQLPVFEKRSLFGKKLERKQIPIILLTLAGLLALNFTLALFSAHTGIDDTQAVVETATALAVFPLATLLFLAFSSLAEEMFFRGFAFVTFGNLLSAIIFTVFHAGYGSLIELVGVFLAALILNHARKESQSIYPGVVAHFLFNAFIIFIWV